MKKKKETCIRIESHGKENDYFVLVTLFSVRFSLLVVARWR